ncbi:MAG: ABC transporter ATP-binding protein [Actinobacteria bacterium]|nr:ABC transporter ATP-binding protein [Actinomycetota bacterium]MCB8997687.1 ABC transporter ATP-binding protein [Actinomycetota bacterium]MCB9423919.1 ABC transporter ATP-binding protein [Actinomycetota bacterium]HRY09100.1 ABC transporter ATP-binding protein [Candidatus Nanopelagicales bacterium]
MAVSTSSASLRLFWDAASATPVRRMVAILGPVFAVGVGQFLGPYVISVLLNQIQAGDVTWASSWPLVAGYLVSQILGTVIGWRVVLWATWTMEVQGMALLFQRVFDHLTEQSVAFHSNRFSGALVSQTNKLLGAFEVFWDTIVWAMMPILTGIIVASVVLAFVVWPYAIFLFVMSMVFILLVFFASRRMQDLTAAEAKAANRMTGFLADVMTNIAAVKAQGSEPDEKETASEVAEIRTSRDLDVMRSFLKFSAGYASVITVINTGAVAAAVLAAEAGVVNIGAIYLAVTYTLTVTSQLWSINEVIRNYNKVLGDAHEMVEILHLPAGVRDRHHAELVVRDGGIRMLDVTFGHDGQYEHPLFEHFDLDIAPGEKVGLVGQSGSGKTTLTRLLLRFSDLQGGRILIDGQDIAEVTQRSLRQQISYVPQEPLLFHRSLRENIAYGLPGATEDQVRHAAERAYALDFIESLPDGFDTLVGERGVKLSGGQRQRIAIARAILKDARILVLDEATSALDSESEVHIQQALAQAMAGRTTLVIAHRLSTIQAMDRILVMDAGRIIEQGSHRELLAAGGTYAALWAHQSGGFLAGV